MSADSESMMLSGMEPMEALSLLSDTDEKYRLIFECGRSEAAQRQKRAGQGEVTERGYERIVPHELLAGMAEEDPDATVEVIE